MTRSTLPLCMTWLAALFATTPAMPDPYAPLARLTGSELKKSVGEMAVRGHRPLSYRELWNVLKEADRHPTHPNHVIGIYSRVAVPTECTEGKTPAGCRLTWNREHVWPKSKAFPRRDQWAHRAHLDLARPQRAHRFGSC